MTKNAPIALITGAGKRIGRHLALQLAAAGWNIAAHYNESESEIQSLHHEIVTIGQQACVLKADLAQEQQVLDLMPECCKKLGVPDLLINNASVFLKDEIETLRGGGFDTQLAINLKAPLLLANAFVNARSKALAPKNNSTATLCASGIANIINITDQRVQNLNPSFFSYTLSKVALQAATTTMAQALAPHMRVNAIAPGPVMQSIHQSEAEFAAECQGTLLGHGTTPEEIYEAVRFILSTKSMTGETITLDGGQHLK